MAGMQMPKKSTDFKDIVDPYVIMKLETSSAKIDLQNQSFTTKYIDDNGFNPVWNEKTEFLYEEDDINFLVIKIMDKDKTDVFLCWNAIPVQCIR